MNEDHVYPRELQFRLGLSKIYAFAELIDPFYPHIIKATLHQSAWNRFVAAGLAWLPPPLQRLVKRIWPRYGLPECVVLKKLRKPEHTEAFENEQVMYRRLAAAQGSLVPYYYGEADCEGDRTNVISFLPWPTVWAQPIPHLEVDVFHSRIEAAMDEMIRYGGGVVHEDPKMNNIMIADDGRFVFIDLESVYVPELGKEASGRKWAILAFVDAYERHLRILQQEAASAEKDRRIMNQYSRPGI
ncbi:hypothetical protein F503_06322 [Ophiostoma piceae UAMH 11346]|uniref:Protein kinase domain-containing protein n=1 Tax=Ophiostoma piceae (strain UAMH 11346) TaxID=1262450 RepID=S3CEQ4_OPHP1|nr:hypothetical protein F503_06322 [Ophiostoma piceae UAMH 11346]